MVFGRTPLSSMALSPTAGQLGKIMFKSITKVVWVLSVVSLLTDIASEMLYPVLPIYLQSIGFSVLLIGVLEGFAEATAGLSKAYFGKLSDASGKRVPFVQLGYLLSAISKPMIAVFGYPIWIFFARTIDRFGKGLRTGARDALLSEEATPQTQGKVFGFHRSMDTLGAVLGPLLALVYLHFYPNDYKRLFYFALFPGLLAVLASFILKESRNKTWRASRSPSFLSPLSYWRESPIIYRKVVIGLLVFTLFNSSDVFLLLMAKEAGLSDATVVGIYIFYNLTYALFALPFGVLADKIGLKKVYIGGLLLFVVVYAGMTISTDPFHFFVLFFLYGMYAAATEGISKAWISTITTREKIATAIGTFAGLQSICTMLASSLTGLIWFSWGSTAAFSLTWVVTLIVIAYFTNLQHPVVVSNEHNASKPT